MSTPVEFDVKYRIATGLSIQGGHITRNVITLVVMLTVGIAIFNYTMKVLVYIHLLTPSHPHTLTPHPPTHPQEFCIIALVGLLCDGFLQLTFFPTVLSIDLRRLEVGGAMSVVHVTSDVYTELCCLVLQLSDLSSATVAIQQAADGTYPQSPPPFPLSIPPLSHPPLPSHLPTVPLSPLLHLSRPFLLLLLLQFRSLHLVLLLLLFLHRW